ncbi:MAG: hypothetical protein NUW21_04240, partial [Elusimicrobia bacterium]|nr:hypothetical protein [Elusimicrobiota bacterium]
LPLRINLQGKLTDPASGAPRNGSFSLTFKIYAAPSGGTALFTESQTVSVDNGVFSTHLGSTALLTPDLFAGASAYLGITVSPDSEMTPRQRLVMSPYAFTSAQLVHQNDVRVNAGNAYSTFTAAGNWLMPAGVVAGTAAFSGSLTASSGTFTATGAGQYSLETSSGASMAAGTLKLAAASRGLDASGTGVTAATAAFTGTGASVFSVTTSSGIDVQNGTLRVRGTGGVDADYGVTAGTVAVGNYVQNAGVAAPPVSPAGAGRIYYDSAANKYMASENGGAYVKLVSPPASQNMWDTNATAAVTNQGANLPTALTELDQAVQGTRVSLNCDDLGDQVAIRYNVRSNQAASQTIVIDILDTSLTSNVLATVSVVMNAAATYTGEGAYAAKPGWCTGVKQVAVYTSGGNGVRDFIFKRIALISKP